MGNMAGCGNVAPVIGGAPVGISTEQTYAPLPAPPFPVPTVYSQNCIPCQIIAQADLAGETTVETAPRGGALFYGSGISSCNNCFEILLNSITTGSLAVNSLPCGAVDAGIFNTDDCFCCFDVGCVSTISPLEMRFEPFGTPSVAPFASIAFWGQIVRSPDDCGFPYGIPAGGWYPGGGYVGGVPAAGGYAAQLGNGQM